MRRIVPPVPRHSSCVRILSGVVVAAVIALTSLQAQKPYPGRNVNVMSGLSLPDGDPYLQRQNEPSVAASTRNPMHLLGGSNDYRTVDIPGLTCAKVDPVTGACLDPETRDAWLGLFKSVDGGQRWKSTLHPGFQQDDSAASVNNPLKGYQAGADAVVRAGTHGQIYYSGLVFDRDGDGKSAVFLSRFIDNNNLEAGDPFAYLGTTLVAKSPAGSTFLDKPWLAVDIPRANAAMCSISTANAVPLTKPNGKPAKATKAGKKGSPSNPQQVPGGAVYVTYTAFSGEGLARGAQIWISRSMDCGKTWGEPIRVSRPEDQLNQGSNIAIDPRNGNVYVAYRRFDPNYSDSNDLDAMMVARIPFNNKKADTAGVVKKFPKPKKNGKLDPLRLTEHRGEEYANVKGAKPGEAEAELEQFDLDDRDSYSFRSLAYPTMAIDGSGRVYLAWTQRGFASDPVQVNGTLTTSVGARIVMTTSLDGKTFTPLRVVDDHTEPGRGHQLMPSMAFAGGKLMLIFYDMRETRAVSQSGAGVHTTRASDIDKTIRHTIDIRSVMATPGDTPVFSESVKVSDYVMGINPRTDEVEQLQVNPPNLPMFKKGTSPFMGDYIDVAAAPAFIPQPNGKWIYNANNTGVTPVFHAVWTDNRDVRPPTAKVMVNGKLVPDWTKYTPARITDNDPQRISLLDGSIVPMCSDSEANAGTRNQNVYTSRIATDGLIAGSPGNAKPLSTTLQRGFVVFASNTTNDTKSYRMTILSQPPGGRASFNQFPLPPFTATSVLPETAIELIVPARSTAARTVYVTSSDPDARINVDVSELVDLTLLPPASYPTAQELPGGAGTTVFINPDVENPDVENPDVENPDVENPDVENAEVYNPDVENPDVENPDVENPDVENPDVENPDVENPDVENPDVENPDVENVRVANPDVENPDVENPDVENPDVENPDVENPDVENPDVENGAISDITWKVTNTGNTTASFNVNVFLAQQQLPVGVHTQLILLKTYRTPVTVPNGCELGFQVRNIILANIPNPKLVLADGEVSDPNDPLPTNATLWLAPGEEGRIVLRVVDDTPLEDRVQIPKLDEHGDPVLNPDGSQKYVTLPQGLSPSENVTSVVQQQSVNTVDAEQGTVEPPIVPAFPAPQAVTDVASTAELTPVTINVLANDSTAFGSTKVISLHPAGMAAHSGGFPGDITYQPATGYLYTQRGIVDPATNALVGRLGAPSPTQIVVYQQANPRTGINYQRVSGTPNAALSALDARPDSSTFHHYLTMPALADSVMTFALDSVNGRLFVLHGELLTTLASRLRLSAIDVDPSRATFHQVLYSIALPAGLRGNAAAVNTRTRKVYLGLTGITGGNQGGVFVVDDSVASPAASRIANTFGNLGVAVNESSNQIFAATNDGSSQFQLNVIDGATLAVATVATTQPMRFGQADERLVVHDASSKVFMRLGSSVVVIDGKRGSPTRNTVLAVIPVGADQNVADIAIDQQLGRVITTGQFDYRADIIDVATHALVRTVPLPIGGTDVAVDPVRHVGFVSTLLTSVVEVDLLGASVDTVIPVFVESGGPIVNPVTNRTYVTGTSQASGIGVVSGAGPLGTIGGITANGRYVASARHLATNRYFVINTGNQAGTSSGPGTVVVIDGATDAVIKQLQTLPVPFGIGIDQSAAKIYVASVTGDGTHGGVRIFNASDLEAPGVDATFSTTTTGQAGAFPLNNPGAVVGFARFVVPNPNDHKVYLLQSSSGSPASVAVLDPNTNVITPLDGAAGTPLYDYQQSHGETWGRANIVRVYAALNRIIIGFSNGTTNRGVVLDGTSLQVLHNVVGGGQSGRHTASYMVLDEAMQRLFVADYAAAKVYMLDAATMAVLQEVAVPAGPDALALNLTTHRLYVSSIDSKMLSALDYTPSSLTMSSSVHLPLVAYHMVVDEVESRVYTSGGDSADESGVMVVTDILGQLGTNVSVTGVSGAGHGTVTLNDDYSVTYTPSHGWSGIDTFTYDIAAPTGTATGTVSITVAPSNPTAVSFGDAFATSYNQPLAVNAPGPLANDAVGGGPVAMVVGQLPTHGQLSAAPDGSFVYTPNVNFAGTDSFTYHTTSLLEPSNESTVTITVSQPNELVVTTTADSGAGSLRSAMAIASSEPHSLIRFAIPGPGPHVIQPTSPLPIVTAPVTIDGYTQAGASPNTAAWGTNAVIMIVINGSSAGGGNGLYLQGGNSTVRGLAIGGFNNNGILMDTAGNNIIEGNFIGTNVTGSAASANSQAGVASQSPNNQIGTASLAGRNLISGNGNGGIRVSQRSTGTTILSNGAGTMVVNNLVGTNAAGIAALANGFVGITVTAPNVTIGGTSVAERNVIAGNNGFGISSSAATVPGVPQVPYNFPTNLVVQGNYVGLRADGSVSLPNATGGLNITGANSLIGGTAGTTAGACTGACNVISGNTGSGINVSAQFENPQPTPNAAMGAVYSTATGSQVIGNFIGVNPAGTAALANTGTGIHVHVPNVTIGSTASGGRNVISGNGANGISFGANAVLLTGAAVAGANATGSIARGNYVGLDAAGTALLPNSQTAILVTVPSVTIGGLNPGDGNYVVGNLVPPTQMNPAISTGRNTTSAGVIATADGTVIQGNVVGLFTNGARTSSRGASISITTSNNQIIGNTIAGLGNGTAPFAASLNISGSGGTANGNTIAGNLFGTNAASASGLGNYGAAISINASSNNVIGGTTAGDRNIVVNQTDMVLFLNGGATVPSNNNRVIGNYFGVMADGVTPAGNTGGIQFSTTGTGVANGNVIGGAAAGERNVMAASGLGNAITLFGAGTTNTVIRGNYIGVAADGTTPRGNAGGIMVQDANGSSIGGPAAADGNLIANNTGNGITVTNLFGSAVRNSILNNRIFANTGLGIDLAANGTSNNDAGDTDAGANNLQNFPVLAGVDNSGATTVVTVDASSFQVGSYTVQVFSNVTCDGTHGEGARFVGGGTIVQPGGQVTLNELVPTNEVLTATATDANGNTSEFSACMPAGGSPAAVINTSDSGAGSLRAAIAYANSTPGAQTITFNIPGASSASPATINLATALPAITEQVTIDGTTQPGYTNAPSIELNGASAAAASGLVVQAPNVTVKALAINRFPQHGIAVQANSFTLHGSYLGLAPNGTTAAGNGLDGLTISGTSNFIGGGPPTMRNVISGNLRDGVSVTTSGQDGNTLFNNYIGTNASGTAAVGNARHGVFLEQSTNVLIGGTPLGLAMNVISGNGQNGVMVNGCDPAQVCNGHSIAGNRIGTNAAGTAAIANMRHGIEVHNAPKNNITQNHIAGNAQHGIRIFATPSDPDPELHFGHSMITGNLIGTDAAGSNAIANGGYGVRLEERTASTVGGPNPADRNTISFNGNGGIYLDRATNNVVQGNYIGLTSNGNGAAANAGAGITLFATATGNMIGGLNSQDGNVISSNAGSGLIVDGATNNTIRNNIIGWDATGSIVRGNAGNGVSVDGSNITVQANRIANNTQNGVLIGSGTGNQLLQNRIVNNSMLGIDLAPAGASTNDPGDADTGANNAQNYPVLTSVSSNGSDTTVVGTLNSTPNTSFRLEFFQSSAADAPGGYGEGAQYLAMLPANTDGSGNFSFSAAMTGVVTAPGQWVSVTATNNATGDTSEFSVSRQVDSDLVVVSNTDSGAGSLRSAITAANALPGTQTIRFAFPSSPALITLSSSLPGITDGVIIDGRTQAGYASSPLIEITSGTPGSFVPFSLNADNIVVRGFSITKFATGIYATENRGGHTVEDNIIGTHPGNGAGNGNGIGIDWRAHQSTIRNNAILGNTGDGLVLQIDGANNQITGNKIGVGLDGTTKLANAGHGVAMYNGAAGNVFTNNVIAANTGWGVNIQNVGAPVSGTIFRSNRIGVDGNGADAGNFAGGIRLENAPGTVVGESGLGNTISGNGGNGPAEIGVGILVLATTGQIPVISSNYIGLDPAGVSARSNNNKGILLEGPAIVGGLTVNERNYISGNGDIGGGAGIMVGLGGGGSTILGNVIGLNVNNDAVGNGSSGIHVRATSQVFIGGNTAAEGNVISGNGAYGINIERLGGDPFPSGAVIRRNRIGTDETETLNRGNVYAGIGVAGTGVQIGGTGVGEGNVIRHNLTGIRVDDVANGVRIERNSIDNNTAMGIDLGGDNITVNDAGDGDIGGNYRQNFPVLSNVNTGVEPAQVTHDTSSFAPGTYVLNFFISPACDANGYGEGRTFAGATTVLSGGPAIFSLDRALPIGYVVTATATDSLGNTSEFSACAQAPASGMVTNQSDSGPGSLRDAITYANNTPGTQTIQFQIPGVNAGNPALIYATSPLPTLSQPVIIDGTTQGVWDNLPVVEVRGSGAGAGGPGFYITSSNVTIRGLAITGFQSGIQTNQDLTGLLIEHNVVGSNRGFIGDIGNGVGLVYGGDNSSIRNNHFVGNGEGLVMRDGASGNTVANNGFGISLSGTIVRGNNGHGIVFYDGASNNTFEANFIAGNLGYGVDMQFGGALVTGTRFWNNTIGLNASGNPVANVLGGMHIQNAPGTVVGGDPGKRNIISGNGGHGLLIEGGDANPMVQVLSNYIGVDPTGTLDRGNLVDGVHIGQATDTLVSGNVLSGNNGNGAHVSVSSSAPEALIRGNIIGLNAAGGAAIPNGQSGITLTGAAADIGGTTVADRNLISGNLLRGITVTNSGSGFNTLIRGNYIGTGVNGNEVLGNTGEGILILNAPSTVVGAWNGGNQIVNNSGRGITVQGNRTGIRLETNGIYANGDMGIDIGGDGVTPNDQPDANGIQNAPEISDANNTLATTYATLDTTKLAAGTYLVEFFKSPTCDASGHGEGSASLIRFGITANTGMAQLNLNSVVPTGWFVTALATSDAGGGHTSEFSACVQVTAPPPAPQVMSISPASTFGSGQTITINGSNFNIAGPQDVIINVGQAYYPASSIFYNSATKIIARTDQFTPIGAGNLTIRTQNGLPLSAAFNVNVQATPVAPNFITVRNGNCGGYGGPGDTPTTWSGNQLLLVASGIGTTGTRVFFTPSGGGSSTEATVLQNCAWVEGDAAVHVQVPALAVGSYDITIRTTVGANLSADSNAKTLNVEAFVVNGMSGGGANGNCPSCIPPAPGPFGPQSFGQIQAGQTFDIIASGQVNNGGTLFGPQGSGPCSECLDQSLPRTALIGRWSGGNWFLIGSGGQFTNPGAADNLQLAINDRDYTDNGGQYSVVISPQ
jgi:hypothetical protein